MKSRNPIVQPCFSLKTKPLTNTNQYQASTRAKATLDQNSTGPAQRNTQLNTSTRQRGPKRIPIQYQTWERPKVQLVEKTCTSALAPAHIARANSHERALARNICTRDATYSFEVSWTEPTLRKSQPLRGSAWSMSKTEDFLRSPPAQKNNNA